MLVICIYFFLLCHYYKVRVIVVVRAKVGEEPKSDDKASHFGTFRV